MHEKEPEMLHDSLSDIKIIFKLMIQDCYESFDYISFAIVHMTLYAHFSELFANY